MTSELTDYECKIVHNVEEFGCHVTTVFDPEGNDPSYSYSTGFPETVDQGEVIVFGLDSDLMHRMVNLLHDMCSAGLVLVDGLVVDGLLKDFQVVARAIPKERIYREHFNSALWFHRRTYGTELERAFQLVWPGASDGLFPWEPACDPAVRLWQPPLYEVEASR